MRKAFLVDVDDAKPLQGVCKKIKKQKVKPHFGATTEPRQSRRRDSERVYQIL